MWGLLMTTTQISLSGSSILNFGNSLANNIICLYGNSLDRDETDVYGFGINDNQLRYNTGSTGAHGFYTGGVDRVTLGETSTFNGDLTVFGTTNLAELGLTNATVG